MKQRVPRAFAVGRIDGLDGWRAILMAGGILLHASSWLDERPLFELVTLLSHTFRMGAFFAISGFLTARSLIGRPPGRWLAHRLWQIGLPTLFGMTVLCPIITATVMTMPGPHPGTMFNWYHLWFLVALLLYAPLAVVADAIDRRLAWRNAIALHLGKSHGDGRNGAKVVPMLAATGLLSLLLLIVSSLAIGALGTADTMPVLSSWRLIAGYLPDYMLGFIVARSMSLQRAMVRDWRTPTLILGVIGVAYTLWFLLLAPRVAPGLRLWGDGLLPLIGEAIAPAAAFALILKSSAPVKRIGPTLRHLADGAFTIYLAHVPVIALLTLVAADVRANAELKYLAIAGLTLAMTLAFHHVVVRRSVWLSILFCGKPPPRKGLFLYGRDRRSRLGGEPRTADERRRASMRLRTGAAKLG